MLTDETTLAHRRDAGATQIGSETVCGASTPCDVNPHLPRRVDNADVVRRWGRLAVCCAVLGIIWLGVLPSVSNTAAVRSRIRFLESRGIDPAAMFYTELDAMDGVLERLDNFHRRNPTALWVPSLK